MQLAANLLGDPGRMPFVGHFRVRVLTEQASLAVAGRVAGEAGVVPGFRAAREIEGALLGMQTSAVVDRNDLLLRAWTSAARTVLRPAGHHGGGLPRVDVLIALRQTVSCRG